MKKGCDCSFIILYDHELLLTQAGSSHINSELGINTNTNDILLIRSTPWAAWLKVKGQNLRRPSRENETGAGKGSLNKPRELTNIIGLAPREIGPPDDGVVFFKGSLATCAFRVWCTCTRRRILVPGTAQTRINLTCPQRRKLLRNALAA